MDEFLSLSRIQEILTSARRLRVGVVGDFTLDGYWHADMTRSALSRETPLFPRPVVRERYSCGGAANVAWNLAALGLAEVRAFTVLGQDWRGDLLRQALHEAGVDPRDILVGCRLVDALLWQGHPDLRQPAAGRCPPGFCQYQPTSAGNRGRTAGPAGGQALPDLDALMVADYQDIGVITPRVLEGLNDLAARVRTADLYGRFARAHRPVSKYGAQAQRIEAARWLFPDRAPGLVGLEEFAEAALYPQVDCGCPLFITLGEKGCLVLSNGESHLVPAVRISPPVDPVGAGDTFLAALTAALAVGASPLEAARLGHLAASVTVRKLGITGAASPEEIMAAAENLSA